jgi:peptide/nickel transport system substrate-binding protein
VNKKVTKIGWIVLAALLCLSLVLVPGCTTPAEEEEEEEPTGIPYRNPGTFITMTFGTVDSLDPAWGYDTTSGEVVQYMYDTLVFFDRESTSEFVPALATEWEFDSATATYRFTIRDNVKFHNGDTLTPEDVEYSFERAMVQNRRGGPVWMVFLTLLGGYASDDFAAMTGAVEVDGDDVLFHLSDASLATPFLQIICNPWGSIVDKSYCIDQGDWDGTEATWQDYRNPDHGTTALHAKENGTGPWKLNLWEPGEQYKLEKFDDYWGGSVPFDFVIHQTVEEWTSRKLALLNGDADYVEVPRQYIGELEDVEDLTKYQDLPELANICMFYTWHMTEDSPYLGSGQLDGNGIPVDFFSDEDVRLGMAYAMDYDTFITDAYLSEAGRRGGPIVDGVLGFDPDNPMYEQDLALAEQHLRDAWDGELWENGCKFTIFYNVGNEQRKVASEILAETLTNLNNKFQISVQPVQWATFVNGFIGHLYPIFVMGWQCDYPDPDNFITPFMASEGDFAWSQVYGSPEIDALIEEARYESDPVARAAVYDELEQIYYEDVPGIMLCQPLGRRFFTKYIHDFYFNPAIPGQVGPLWDMSKSES